MMVDDASQHDAVRRTSDLVPAEEEGEAHGISTTVTTLRHRIRKRLSESGFLTFEMSVVYVCALIPFLLLLGSPQKHFGSISEYYAMTKAQFFYVPLTIAATLFLVNGFLRGNHPYNLVLGLALLIVVLFNCIDHKVVHDIAAVVFFVGNALVFVFRTPKWMRRDFVVAAVLMLAVFAGYFWFHKYSLFLAESVSLWIIAWHFLRDEGLLSNAA